ncbi:methyltransferase domain-containing protein [Saliphagus sp. LR7]|uniref:methyltransferase domain-containing protein n=1 Tax=Saliphagus sp. LR7 TaxID=2282654 RepID=UPI000DF7D052|nr:methyltransferase domain-containing protein [Saliphagus sp. LR7]
MYLLELAGEDDGFARREAESAAAGVEEFAPGLAIAGGLVPDRIAGLAYTRRASELIGHTDANVESARALLAAGAPDREGSVAVRARDVRGTAGISTEEAERVLGTCLVDRGFAVDLDDPDHVLRAVFSGEVCALGWLAGESVRDFGSRAPTGKPFFQPGSMDPLLARAVANVAGAGPGAIVVDPMCGTGGILVEAGLVGSDVVGIDAQAKMVRGSRENLAHYLARGVADGSPLGEPGTFAVARGDATRLPLADGAADGVVFDAPYGRQSKIARHRLADLVAGALAEARRVADRAVVVGDRSWADAARGAGWAVESAFERRVHRSLDRHVLVLK